MTTLDSPPIQHTTTTDESTWLIRIAAALVLAALIPLSLGIPDLSDLRTSTAIFFAIVVIAALRIARIVAVGLPTYVELTFWIFAYIWGGLAPIAQIEANDYPWAGSYTGDETDTAAIITVIGLIGWIVGKRLADRARPAPTRSFDDGRIGRFSVLAIAIGLGGISIIGIGTFFTSRIQITQMWLDLAGESEALSQLFRAALTIPPALAVYLLALRRREPTQRSAHGRRLMVLIAIVLIVANPITNARFVFGSLLFAWTIAFVGPQSRRAARLVSSLLVAGVIIVFPIADAFRNDVRSDVTVQLNSEMFVSGDYDSLQQTMNGRRLATAQGPTLGRQAIGVPLFFVPRSVWADKPEPAGITIAEYAEYSYTNLASPFWIEGYLDFGVMGSATMGLFLGWLAGRIQGAGLKYPQSPLGSVAPFFAAYQLVLLRGAIMAVFSLLAIWLALTWLVSRPIRSEAQMPKQLPSR